MSKVISSIFPLSDLRSLKTGFQALVFVSILLSLPTCKYSFSGISIPLDVKTFYVEPFEILAPNADPNISQLFSDALRDKVTQESRLTQTAVDPDCEFKGSVTRYSITAVAPKPGEVTAFNRLDISVSVEFINNKDEEQDWKQTFPYFAEFDSNESFLAIQDGLIEDINEQLVEDIFNKAFTNW